ncbi:MAG TPA: hypothetical protein VLH08_05420 [Acidobacteriota bacterium]|nr:hypothetical protein [Acidobacteriota bacterium]
MILVTSIFTSFAQAEIFTFTQSDQFVFHNATISSTLGVTGVSGNVQDVSVTLSGLKANPPAVNGIEEFDILLVNPQGTKVILMAFVCDFTNGPVNFTFDNAGSVLPQGDTGVSCSSGTYKPSDFSMVPGADGYTIGPPAPAPPYSTNLDNLNGQNANGTWTLWAAEWHASNQGGTIQSWSITITTDSAEQCVKFSDDFNDNVVNWDIVKPIATESGGNTILTPATKKSEIEASNVFSGCGANCTVNTEFQTAGGIGSKVWVLGWFVDKRNLIEVLIREDKNRVTVRQRIDKTIVAKSSANVTINPDTLYTVTMIYDGSLINVFINGVSNITLNPVGNISGSVGLRSTNTTSTFTHMCVD